MLGRKRALMIAKEEIFVFNPEHGGRHYSRIGVQAPPALAATITIKGVDEPLMPCWDDFFEERNTIPKRR